MTAYRFGNRSFGVPTPEGGIILAGAEGNSPAGGMPDFTQDLLGTASPPAETPEKSSAPDFRRDLLGSGHEVRATTAQPRPIGDTREKAAGFWATMRASLAPDDKLKIKRLSEAMGIPEDRFGIVGENLVYGDDEGNLHRVTPSVFGGASAGEDFMRAGNWAAAQVGPTIPQVAGTVAGMASGPTPASIATSAGAAGSADLARQALDRALAGESIFDVDPLNAAGHALQAGSGQALAVGVSKAFINRNPLQVGKYDRADALDPRTQQQAGALQNRARKWGVKLTPGQATDLPSLKVNERQLGRYPETMNPMSAFRDAQDQQVRRAVTQFADDLSPVTSTEQGARMMREGAEEAVNKAVSARRAAAVPLYDEAFKANQNIASPTLDRILETPAGREALKRASIKMRNEMTRMGVPDAELTEQAKDAVLLGKMAEGEVPKGGVASGLKLRAYDYIKRALGDMEEAALAASNRDDARIIGNLRRALVSELDELDVTARTGPASARPDGGAYARAREAYAARSPDVTALSEGPVGKMAEPAMGGDLPKRTGTLLDFNRIAPHETRRARAAFIDAGREAEWGAGVRAFIEDKIAGIEKNAGNLPGRIHTELFKDERARAVMREALGPERYQGFRQLMRVIEAAGRRLPEGSPTATDLGGVKGFSVLAKVARAFSPQEIGARVGDKLDEAATVAMRRRVLDAVLAPDNLDKLKKLRMLSPTGERAVVLSSQIVGIGAEEVGERYTGLGGPQDFEPPYLARLRAAGGAQ